MSNDLIPRHRLDALIDAVIAISMTLLVLELRLPDNIEGNVYGALLDLSPKVISWVVSFLILALCWHGNARGMRQVEQVDTRLFWLTMFWLLITTVLPFSSSLLGEHNELTASNVVYAGNIIAIQIVVLLRDLHLASLAQLAGKPTRVRRLTGWIQALAVIVPALVCMAVATRVPAYASLSFLLIIPLSVVARRAGYDD